MNWRIIRTLYLKDLKLFFRDKFFGIMTIFGVILFIAFYLIMPKSVDETIKIGFFAPPALNLLFNTIQEEGLIIHNFTSEEELKQAIINQDYLMGISIPTEIGQSLFSGEDQKIIVYYSADLDDEFKEMYTIFLHEFIHTITGNTLNINFKEVVLGPDMGGNQIPHRDRMIPLFIFFILIMETFGLSNLITSEIERGTMEALITTPMNVIDLFLGKGITGVSLAFSQAVLFIAITGSLAQNSLFIVLVLLLGSMLVTGLSFFIAAISKDMMSVVAWGTLVMIILIIPAITKVFPGPVSGWIKIIPSYCLVDILYRVINFNIGLDGNWANLLFLSGFNILFVLLGIFTLKRKIYEY